MNPFRLIKNNEKAKTLASNFAWLTLLQIAGYALPFITIPYLARTIGVVGFGKIAFATAIMWWIQTIADWGFNFTATRDIARQREDINVVSHIFSNVLWARVMLMFASFIILALLVVSIPLLRQDWVVIFMTFLMIPGHIMCPDWFFQAMEKMRFITIINITAKLIFTLSVFIFIHQESDYIYQPLLSSLGWIISGFITFYIILTKWHVKIHPPCFRDIFATLKGSTDVFINNLMPNLYNSFSSILLGFWGGSVPNGLLDAGQKFAQIASNLLQVVSRTFFPFLSRDITHHGKFALGYISLSVVAAALLYILSPLLIHIFYTEPFYPAITASRILAFSLIFIVVSNVYGTNFLIVQGYDRQLRRITVVVSLFGFILSFPLVYYFSFIGAALTITISRALLALGAALCARRIKRLNQ